MDLSKHAKVRGQQRGISDYLIETILTFGTATQKPGNVKEYRIDKKKKSDLISTYKKRIKALEKIDKKRVILGNDGTVITVYNSIN